MKFLARQLMYRNIPFSFLPSGYIDGKFMPMCVHVMTKIGRVRVKPCTEAGRELDYVIGNKKEVRITLEELNNALFKNCKKDLSCDIKSFSVTADEVNKHIDTGSPFVYIKNKLKPINVKFDARSESVGNKPVTT